MNESKRCFVIMPFGKEGTPEHDHNWKIYELMIKPVLEECGYESIRADELEHPGSITRDIIEYLYECDLVVADLSGWSANVFYELGVRHSLFRCGTIPIIRKDESLPFDISNYRAISYSSKLGGPERFRKELEQRINAFERLTKKRSDNPVHDILGDKLKTFDSDQFIPKKIHAKKLREIEKLRSQAEKSISKQTAGDKQLKSLSKEKDSAQQQVRKLEQRIEKLEAELQQEKKSRFSERIKAKPEPNVDIVKSPFRTQPKTLSEDEVKSMLKKHDFFDSSINKNGRGYANAFKAQILKGYRVVVNRKSGLMWQQAGSAESMEYKAVKNRIDELNREGYAGYHDWRLPTLEEAMSLMEPKKNNAGLYIDSKFDSKQSWIWTDDPVGGTSQAWVVDFNNGNCKNGDLYSYGHVRCIRLGQSSGV